MSSSMFIEPSSDKQEGNINSDSNLVVVYGKNGVNIDPKDLEALIEEKAVQTISVIRITSPTPSMEDAEEAARIEAAKEAQDDADDKDDNKRGEDNLENKDRSSADTEEEAHSSSDEQLEDNENDSSSENDVKSEKANIIPKRRGRRRRNASKIKTKLQGKKQESKHDTEIVGLTLEGFYEAESALQIAKEACKMAGIPYMQNKAEYEFTLLVIRNDHCYTPFTSPEQMKAKIAADKLEAEKLAAARKVQPLLNNPSRQFNIKTKRPSITNTVVITKKYADESKTKVEKVTMENKNETNPLRTTDEEADDDESFELIDVEESDHTASDLSAASENDRDSDLDFNVHNRQTKKRRVQLSQKKARRLINAKMQEKRTQQNQDERAISTMNPVSNISPASSPAVSTKVMSIIKPRSAQSSLNITSRQIRHPQMLTVSKPGAIEQLVPIKSPSSVGKLTTKLATSVRPGNIVQMASGLIKTPTSLQQHAVKEIILNKSMSSPKGCFTELTTLISEAEKSASANPHQASTTSTSTQAIASTSNISRSAAGGVGTPTSSRTGFMRIDASAKNQLPAQISIETHQSSNEHDKQIVDLIDSIVKEKMNKSTDAIAESSNMGINENIPKLVEMLESTEKSLEAKETITTPATQPLSNELDITHELPEELLQLIEEDKTLQDAIEKHILEDENNFINDNALNTSMPSTSIIQQSTQQQQQQPLQPQTPKVNTASQSNVRTIQLIQPSQNLRTLPATIPIPLTSTSKSIIQMSISNTGGNSSPSSRSSPLTRRDPIQIVRGNGRVITLPPIEAPTTRAKRRAQTTPIASPRAQHKIETTPIIINESSMDSSLQSNSSLGASSLALSATETNTSLNEKKQQQQQREAIGKRRTSKEGGSGVVSGSVGGVVTLPATVTKTSRKSVAGKSNKRGKQDDAEASESQADDDDPDKLWCVCRQPHNNRFMICCDACGDWFHGTCVNVTKAMGREMEQKGLEWSCPQCVKKREDKKQRKLTDMLQTKRLIADDRIDVSSHTQKSLTRKDSQTDSDNKKIAIVQQIQTPTIKKTPTVMIGQRKLIIIPSVATSTSATVTQNKGKIIVSSKTPQAIRTQGINTATSTSTTLMSTTATPTPTAAALCVFCKKAARPETVYCSDECIRRCAQNGINAYTAKSSTQSEIATTSSNIIDEKKKKSKGLFEDFLAMPDRKPKVERITVYDRKTGIRLMGNTAPTTLTIRKWLQENPTFEIVLPGSQLSLELEQKQQQQSLRTPVTTKTIGGVRIPKQNVVSSTDVNKTTANTPQNSQKVIISSSSSPSSATTNPSSSARTIKQIIDEHKQGGSASPIRSGTPKQLQKYPQQVHIRPDSKSPRIDEVRSKDRNLKRQSSEGSAGGGGDSSSSSTRKSADTSISSPSSNADPNRRNVRRTLTDLMIERMNEVSVQSPPTDHDDIIPSTSIKNKLTSEEIENFVKETEAEMYNFFNRDTGAKYKNKYRSLIFNIKDRKNKTLFAKICAKQIKPKQLVHMSPEELASQELAQWREKENKHQLEMIKKSELDLLSCTKNYLFKNHKGEEIIESKTSDVCVNLDMAIPVEDVVNVLNNSTTGLNLESEPEIGTNNESIGSDFEQKQFNSPRENIVSPEQQQDQHSNSMREQQQHHHHQHHSHHEHSVEKSSDDKRRSNRDRSRERERRYRSKSRDSEKERERDRDRDRGRERRHRSRSRDSEKDRHHHSRDRYHRDKSRSKRRSHSRSRSRSPERRHRGKEERRDRDREREKKDKKGIIAKTPSTGHMQSKDKHRDSPIITASTPTKRTQTSQKPVECFSLIDQIIESSKTVEEAANLVKDSAKDKLKEKEKTKEVQHQASPIITTTTTTSSTTQEVSPSSTSATTKMSAQSSSTADSDQEPSSTVSIPTPPHDPYTRYASGEEASFSRPSSPSTDFESPPLWTGSISMNEVATLQMKIHHLIGNSRYLDKMLPENLEVVGRIDAETVWEYLWKIRKSPNKEIVLIHLMPSGEDETEAFSKLFLYLDQKKRLGVIKSMTPQIKDFYIFPLGAGKQLPKVLQVTDHNDFYEDPFRSNMLIGIIVKVLSKRMNPLASSSSVAAVVVSSTPGKSSRRNRNDTITFTPPGSPKRKKRPHKNEIDIDAIIKAPIVLKKSSTASTSAVNDDADEPYSPGGSSDDDIVPMFSAKPPLGLPSSDFELKRKMEEINRQIAAQEMEIAGLLNVEPSAASASVLANISIPSNLPQILASIKNIPNKEVPTINPALADSSRRIDSGEFEEYNPEEVIGVSSYTAARHSLHQPTQTAPSTSRLAQLSEAELLSMVPDDMIIETSKPPSSKSQPISSYYQEPPPPGV